MRDKVILRLSSFFARFTSLMFPETKWTVHIIYYFHYGITIYSVLFRHFLFDLCGHKREEWEFNFEGACSCSCLFNFTFTFSSQWIGNPKNVCQHRFISIHNWIARIWCLDPYNILYYFLFIKCSPSKFPS